MRIGEVFNGVALMVLVAVLLCILPAVFLWSLNSLAALGGVAFYIEHSIWSYWVSFCFLVCFGGVKFS